MAAKIEIRDGNPWWLSPDIWVVPGNDPNGAAGYPIAGQTNYLWAQVHNTGTVPVNQAQINFYWSNPATGVFRSTSHQVGSAFVDLGVGESKNVLCISPWVPVIVNDGHECVVAEAIHSADPLPNPLPDDFSPPTYHQVAQKNIHVYEIIPNMKLIYLPIQVSAASRHAKKGKVIVESARLEKEQEQLLFKQIGLKKPLHYNDGLVKFGISRQGGCHVSKEAIGKNSMEIQVAENTSMAVFIHIEQQEHSKAGYQLLNVVEVIDGKVSGGNSILIFKH